VAAASDAAESGRSAAALTAVPISDAAVWSISLRVARSRSSGSSGSVVSAGPTVASRDRLQRRAAWRAAMRERVTALAVVVVSGVASLMR